ncbi:MAG: YggS family pyridoxal phosphate-dependent enzyme [Pseudoclavibacter sp.]|nr:YggS family pyridoxal phosphate-dependent enzyme [Pseudoclavibacter sp.]
MAAVRGRIDEACRRAGRDPAEVELIVVTKFHPPALALELHRLGVRDLGENRHPEARDKALAVDAELPAGEPRPRWHFIGQVQTKKARQIARYAHSIHSVDRPGLVDALRGIERAEPLEVFVQLSLDDDRARGGVAPEGLLPLVERVLETPSLRLRGLMHVAPLDMPAERAFATVRELSERVRELEPAADALSMGMSGDFGSAISQQATHLRIGAAITGKRPPGP